MENIWFAVMFLDTGKKGRISWQISENRKSVSYLLVTRFTGLSLSDFTRSFRRSPENLQNISRTPTFLTQALRMTLTLRLKQYRSSKKGRSNIPRPVQYKMQNYGLRTHSVLVLIRITLNPFIYLLYFFTISSILSIFCSISQTSLS